MWTTYFDHSFCMRRDRWHNSLPGVTLSWIQSLSRTPGSGTRMRVVGTPHSQNDLCVPRLLLLCSDASSTSTKDSSSATTATASPPSLFVMSSFLFEEFTRKCMAVNPCIIMDLTSQKWRSRKRGDTRRHQSFLTSIKPESNIVVRFRRDFMAWSSAEII